MSLEVLRCSSCGAPVSLVDGATTPCPRCAEVVPLPHEYRALAVATARHDARRAEALALRERLSRPPSWLTRLLAGAHGGTVVGLVTLGAIASAFVGAGLFALSAFVSRSLFHVDLDDVVLSRIDERALFVLVQFALLLGGLGSLIVLGAATARRGAGLRELQAGLSAKLPEREGGTFGCRQCGAPLGVVAAGHAVTCSYCHADNLVRLPQGWLIAARGKSQKLQDAIEDAVRAFRDEEREIRRSRRVRLFVVLGVAAVVLFVLGGMTDFAKLGPGTDTLYRRSGADFYRFDWALAVASPSLVLERADAVGCRRLDCHVPVGTTPCSERMESAPFVVPDAACDSEACTLHWYVALRRGDTLRFQLAAPPRESFVTLNAHARGAAFHADARAFGESTGEFGWLKEGVEATLTAPHDGWFQVLLGLGEPVAGHSLALCVQGPAR